MANTLKPSLNLTHSSNPIAHNSNMELNKGAIENRVTVSSSDLELE